MLITGGSSGIGAATASALVSWGAHIIIACRNGEKGEVLKQSILTKLPDAKLTIYDEVDTSDLGSIRVFSEKLASNGLSVVDALILNAGIADRPHTLSKQGFELHCATNVLGHHLLTRQLLPYLEKSENGRIVSVTGDIYILADDCTLDYEYSSCNTIAYARSKLGVLWNALSYHEMRTSLAIPHASSIAVHPGVVCSDLMEGPATIKKKMLISTERGAQTSLIAAANPSYESGTYLHNTRRIVQLKQDDPAMNREKRKRFWDECELAIRDFVSE